MSRADKSIEAESRAGVGWMAVGGKGDGPGAQGLFWGDEKCSKWIMVRVTISANEL